MKFSKTGRVRFLSHLDFITFFHRAVVRAGVRVAFSHGFNPHPRIAFGPALPVGIEGEAEYADMETDPFTGLEEIKKRLNEALPDGIRIHDLRVIPKKTDSLSAAVEKYEYKVQVPEQWTAGIEDRVRQFLSRTSVVVTRERSSKDIRACIVTVKVAPPESGITALMVSLEDKENIKPRIQDVITQCFEIEQDDALLFKTKRTAVYYRDRETWKDPLDI
jgi:radical SAM-linked protein